MMFKHLLAKGLTGEDFLPDGPLRDMGDAYLNRLPNVEESPLSPESFMKPSEWSWSDYAVAYGLLYPYIALIVFLLGVWVVIRLKRSFMKREYEKRQSCGHCGTLMFGCSPRCPHCSTDSPSVHAISWLGFSSQSRFITPDRVFEHRLRSHRRCPNCASFLIESKIAQSCPDCGVSPFARVDEVMGFDRFVQKRAWWTVLLVFVIGFIPIVGPLLSGAFYRRTLIAPYSLYMNVFKESGVAVFLLVLRYLFRFLPMIGIIGLPLLALVEDYVYRKMFVMRGKRVDWGTGSMRSVANSNPD